MFLKEDTLHSIRRAQALYEQGPAVISSDLQQTDQRNMQDGWNYRIGEWV